MTVTAQARSGTEQQITRVTRKTWRRNSPATTWTSRLVVWGGILAAWEAAAHLDRRTFLPPIEEILLTGMPTIFKAGYVWTLVGSLRQLCIGFVIACAIAIPVGALMGRSRVLRDLLSPYVMTLFFTPVVALMPVLIITVGTGLTFRTTVVVLLAYFFPLVNTAKGVANVPVDLVETARAFGIPRYRTYLDIHIPSAFPYVVAGARLGLGLALNGMIVAELWAVHGTGGILLSLARHLQLAEWFALAFLIGGLAVVVNVGLKAYERRLAVKWGGTLASVVE